MTFDEWYYEDIFGVTRADRLLAIVSPEQRVLLKTWLEDAYYEGFREPRPKMNGYEPSKFDQFYDNMLGENK